MEEQNSTNIDAGKRLRLFRSSIGLSTRAIAEEIGKSSAYYNRMENGKAEITVDVLSKLYQKFGLIPNFITIGESPMLLGPESKKGLLSDIAKMKADMLAMESKVRIISRKK